MKLINLVIPKYHNLRNFEITFGNIDATTVLLGRNGSGKSNLLEALVEIFRGLEFGQVPPFAFRLEYVCRDRRVLIDADPNRTVRQRLNITVDGESLTFKEFQLNADVYLPSYLFAYYSGWSSRLERHFDEPTRRYYREILAGNVMPLRRLFFCRKDYSQLVLLAFFLTQSEQAHALLEKYLGIKRFDSAIFVLKTPWWRGGGAPSQIQLAEGDPRFWYARGAFKAFLNRLWVYALAPIRNVEAVERDIRRQPEQTERLYLFIKDTNELLKLRGETQDPKLLFSYLESLFLCDLIDEVRVTVERADGSRVKFPELSEGEQQLLTVLGLLLFTQDDESLYLLDEPDTHLNPVWTYEYLQLLQDHLRADRGELILATHNPLMIGSLHSDQVRILRQDATQTVAEKPVYEPVAIGIEGLLKSEMYGLRSTLAPEILEMLDRHYELLGKINRTEAEDQELWKLVTTLNQLGVARTHPNPYFEQFATAMARHAPVEEVALTREEIEDQARLAEEVLAEILEEEQVDESR